KRIYLLMADLFFIDPDYRPAVNRLRSELGMPSVSRILHHWIQSPQLIVGLFPEWYVRPYPRDWPNHTVLTEFPLHDDRSSAGLSQEMREFLNRGDPPVVFSPGTGMAHAREFFANAVDACSRLGRRGLLLTRFPELLPDKMPEFIH